MNKTTNNNVETSPESNEAFYTRQDYMGNKCTHDEYYGQFGIHMLKDVENCIGYKTIIHSTDKHFNNIPLRRFDNMQGIVVIRVGRLIGKANGNGCISLSDCVCTVKAACHMIRDEYLNRLIAR